MEHPDLDGLPCAIPFLRHIKPCAAWTDGSSAIARRASESIRTIYAHNHVLPWMAGGKPVRGAFILLTQGIKQMKGTTPGGLNVCGSVKMWNLFWVVAHFMQKKAFDLRDPVQASEALTLLATKTAWRADEIKKQEARQISEAVDYAKAALIAARKARFDRYQDHAPQAASQSRAEGGGVQNDAAVRELERRVDVVGEEIIQTQAEYIVNPTVETEFAAAIAREKMVAPLAA